MCRLLANVFALIRPCVNAVGGNGFLVDSIWRVCQTHIHRPRSTALGEIRINPCNTRTSLSVCTLLTRVLNVSLYVRLLLLGVLVCGECRLIFLFSHKKFGWPSLTA